MKSAAERDRVVGAVHTIRAKWRWLEDVPLAGIVDAETANVVFIAGGASLDHGPAADVAYVEALYAICARGALLGRTATALVGTKD